MTSATKDQAAEPSVAETAALRVSGLTVEAIIGSRSSPVVSDVSFEVGRGEVVGLVGESGSGKTMTCLAILGLLPRRGVRISAGRISLGARSLLDLSRSDMEDLRGRHIGLIPQEPAASLNPAFTVGDQLSEVLRRHLRLTRSQARRRAAELLDGVGIPAAAKRMSDYPHQFSGGMCQRVLIAMALACQPSVVIADEPTTALDVTVQAQILELLRMRAAEQGTAVLLVTHDMAVVADLCDRIVVMYAGRIVETGVVDAMFRRPRHPYTERLLAATPRMRTASELAGAHAEFAYIPGAMPRPGDHSNGCLFGPRCAHHDAVCDVAEPELRMVGTGAAVRCCQAEELDLSTWQGAQEAGGSS